MSGALAGFEVIPATKYQDALQHPDKAFRDPVLQGGRIEMRGQIPKYRSGGFAVVYRLSSRDNPQHKEELLAVRCFKRLAPDLARRYEAISDHLSVVAAKSPFLATTRYLAEGIRIDGSWKPITTMGWIEGEFLDVFLDTAASQPHLMGWLESRIRALAEDLQRNGIAHGDLHHKNILISRLPSGFHSLKLIDYDGMYVPSLSRSRASELGQANYQHPDRGEEDFNEHLDAFALMTIYLNVVAVQRHPELWDPQNRLSDGLLTCADDYRDPDGSAVLARLAAYADLRDMVSAFRRACLGRIQDLMAPRDFFALAQAREAQAPAPEPARVRPVVPKLAQSRLAARERRVIGAARRELRAYAGEVVTVVGQYERYEKGTGSAGSPYRTLHLAATGGATFEVIAERPIAEQFRTTGRPWKVSPGDWLRVDGLLLNDGDRFVVDLDQAADLTRLETLDAARLLKRSLTGRRPEDVAPNRRAPAHSADGRSEASDPLPDSGLRNLLGMKGKTS